MPNNPRINAIIALLFLQLLPAAIWAQNSPDIYIVKNSTTLFHSNAKLELIKAESTKLRGAIDVIKRTFAFAIDIYSFEGFNSPLQKEHFNENYMETEKFPTATFSGRIVEDDDFTKDGNYNIRAKGKFTVHGVEQERIVQGDLQVKNGVIKLHCYFTVFLSEHDIKIPKIVYEKLASEITVDINAEFVKK
jgi:polyisoprenoid-binding protein YceI